MAKKITTREQKTFRRVLRHGLKSLADAHAAAPEACPDSATLVDYEMGNLDAERMREVNRHISHCRDCFGDVLALLGPEKIQDLLKGERVIQGNAAEPKPPVDSAIAVAEAKESTELCPNLKFWLAEETNAEVILAHVVHCERCTKKFRLLLQELDENSKQRLEKLYQSIMSMGSEGQQLPWWQQVRRPLHRAIPEQKARTKSGSDSKPHD